MRLIGINGGTLPLYSTEQVELDELGLPSGSVEWVEAAGKLDAEEALRALRTADAVVIRGRLAVRAVRAALGLDGLPVGAVVQLAVPGPLTGPTNVPTLVLPATTALLGAETVSKLRQAVHELRNPSAMQPLITPAP